MAIATSIAIIMKKKKEISRRIENLFASILNFSHVMSSVSQIFASREAMIKKLRELMAEQAELQKRNRLLELQIIQDAKKVRERARQSTTESLAPDISQLTERIYSKNSTSFSTAAGVTLQLSGYTRTCAARALPADKSNSRPYVRVHRVCMHADAGESDTYVCDKGARANGADL